MADTDDELRKQHEKRSEEAADSLRKFLVTLNSGAVALLAVYAREVRTIDNDLAWVAWSISMFSLGIAFTLFSIFLLKHRSLARRDAAREGKPDPQFKWYIHSWYWDLASTVAFGLGVGIVSWFLASWSLGLITFAPIAVVSLLLIRIRRQGNQPTNSEN